MYSYNTTADRGYPVGRFQVRHQAFPIAKVIDHLARYFKARRLGARRVCKANLLEWYPLASEVTLARTHRASTNVMYLLCTRAGSDSSSAPASTTPL